MIPQQYANAYAGMFRPPVANPIQRLPIGAVGQQPPVQPQPWGSMPPGRLPIQGPIRPAPVATPMPGGMMNQQTPNSLARLMQMYGGQNV